jgi:hypothetical protein
LERLKEAGLVLNLDKCVFGRQAVDFLGHRITAEGAAPLEDHVAAVKDFPLPADKQGLQRFLGLVNAQIKYSAFDRELLAAYLAVQHFRFLLEG